MRFLGGLGVLLLAVFLPAQPVASQDAPTGPAGDTASAPQLSPSDSLRLRILERVRDLSQPPVEEEREEEDEAVAEGEERVERAPAPAGTPPARAPGQRRGVDGTTQLPSGADSTMQALARLPGYTGAAFQGTRADYEAGDRRLFLQGTEEDKARFWGRGVRLEADSGIVYDDRSGRVRTQGSTLLDPEQGDPMRSRSLIYDLTTERGSAMDAETTYNESGFEWKVRGDLDSVEDGLIFGTRARFTSSDTDPPRSFFQADELKVVANQILVARSVRLYFDNVEDGPSDPVPVAWLPFLAQPIQQGRSSGLLTPGFSVNDIVRTSSGSDRRVSNIGYYWAMSDYSDLTVAMDWWSNRYIALTGGLRYRWAQQFLQGEASFRNFWRETGQQEFAISTRNNWEATERTRARVQGNFVTNTGIVRENSLEPRELTGSIDSSAGLDHRFQWGSLSLSSSRKQFLNDDRVEMTLPSASLSISTVTLFPAPPTRAAWYNNVSLNGSTRFERSVREFAPQPDTLFQFNRTDQVRTTANGRSSVSLGNLSLSGDVSFRENLFQGVPRFVVDPEVRPDPEENGPDAASSRRSYLLGESTPGGHVADVLFSEHFDPLTGERVDFADARTDWNVSLSYQQRLIGATTLTPSLTVGGALARVDSIPEARSFVSGPQRLSMGLSAQTEVFGFYPGFGRFDAVRHKVTPSVSWSYSPATTPTQLQDRVFGARNLRVQNQLTFGFNQTWEARVSEEEAAREEAAMEEAAQEEAEREEAVESLLPDEETGEAEEESPPPPVAPPSRDRDEGDGGPTRLPPSRVVTLLALSTSAVSYDIVEADSTGRFIDGFTTTRISNSVRSDFLRGLDLSFTHSIFEDPVGQDAGPRRFAPHLEQLSLGFSLDHRTGLVRWITGFLGVETEEDSQPTRPMREDPLDDPLDDEDPLGAGDGYNQNRVLPGSSGQRAGRTAGRREGWDARLSYSLRRPRESGAGSQLRAQMINATLSFAPTENWDATWQTSFDVEDSRFNDHVVRLRRDLQEWEASFGFRQTVTGNWSFQFEVSLRANRDLRFDHEQRSIGDRRNGQRPF